MIEQLFRILADARGDSQAKFAALIAAMRGIDPGDDEALAQKLQLLELVLGMGLLNGVAELGAEALDAALLSVAQLFLAARSDDAAPALDADLVGGGAMLTALAGDDYRLEYLPAGDDGELGPSVLRAGVYVTGEGPHVIGPPGAIGLELEAGE